MRNFSRVSGEYNPSQSTTSSANAFPPPVVVAHRYALYEIVVYQRRIAVKCPRVSAYEVRPLEDSGIRTEFLVLELVVCYKFGFVHEFLRAEIFQQLSSENDRVFLVPDIFQRRFDPHGEYRAGRTAVAARVFGIVEMCGYSAVENQFLRRNGREYECE